MANQGMFSLRLEIYASNTLSTEEMQKIRDWFIEAAVRAQKDKQRHTMFWLCRCSLLC